MVEWLAGNRLRGTSTERTTTTVSTPPTISTDGNYTVLKYTEDGVFIPKGSFNVEWLVVAGGGGGSATEAGGAGAGGYRTGTGHGVTPQSYSITVGSGGAGGLASGGGQGSNGSDSIFDTITSTGGGASKNNGVSNSGGSGGGGDNTFANGAGNTPSITPITGETTTVQGYAGGTATGSTSPNYGKGGGGGAGSAGGVGTSSATGDGGDGLQNDILVTGTNIYYAGGGSGTGRTDTAVGGQGGGGISPSYGSAFTSTMNGTNGLGGGGAGANATGSNGGSGGSGVVIIRFLTSGNDYLTTAEIFMPMLQGTGGWKELARVSLTSNNSTFSVTIPEQKRYYMVLSNYETTGTANPYMRINADANQYYPQRYSMNGAGDGTPTTFTGFYGNVSGQYSGIPYFSVDHWANKSGQEKLVVRNLVMQNTAGASNAPNRAQMVGKYTQTGDMSSILIHGGTYYGNATNGSEIIVLGWDEGDTHTDNFWEELASVEYNASTPNELDTGTITAKKYLWVQAYVNTTGTQDNQAFRFNGNTGNNYCWRDSRDGATDVLSSPVAYNYLRTCVGDDGNNFVNAFISNKDGREKLIMSSAVKQSTAGTGVAPESNETVGKYTVQSGQITSIKLWQSGGGSFASGSIMKVWGHD